MKTCKNCNASLEDGDKFCPNCGTVQSEPDNSAENETKPADAKTSGGDKGYGDWNKTEPQNNQQERTNNGGWSNQQKNRGGFNGNPDVTQPASGIMNSGMLIWSIINMVLCCQVLGVIALIMTVLAPKATNRAEEVQKNKNAKILNIVGTAGGFVFIVVYVILVIAGTVNNLF